MSDDYNLARLREGISRLRGGREFKKRNIILLIILVVGAGLFFSVLLAGGDAYAQKPVSARKPRPETVDPLEKIGQSSFSGSVDRLCQARTGIIERGQAAEQNAKEKEKAARLKNMLAGYPIEQMAPYIAEQNKTVAAFLVGIARKESTWGEHAPHLDGRDCYNYWGYKGGYHLVDGYSCFDSPQQAVSVVGRRLQTLVDQKLNTPAKMVIWKCGGQCQSDSGAGDWVAAVSQYFYKLDF